MAKTLVILFCLLLQAEILIQRGLSVTTSNSSNSEECEGEEAAEKGGLGGAAAQVPKRPVALVALNIRSWHHCYTLSLSLPPFRVLFPSILSMSHQDP